MPLALASVTQRAAIRTDKVRCVARLGVSVTTGFGLVLPSRYAYPQFVICQHNQCSADGPEMHRRPESGMRDSCSCVQRADTTPKRTRLGFQDCSWAVGAPLMPRCVLRSSCRLMSADISCRASMSSGVISSETMESLATPLPSGNCHSTDFSGSTSEPCAAANEAGG